MDALSPNPALRCAPLPRLPSLSQWQDSRETYAPEAKWKEKERFAAKIPPNICQTQIFLLEIIRTERNLPRIFPNSIRFGRFLPRRSPVKQFSGKGNTFRPPFVRLPSATFFQRCRTKNAAQIALGGVLSAFQFRCLKRYFTEGVSDGSFGAVLMFTLGACGALP